MTYASLQRVVAGASLLLGDVIGHLRSLTKVFSDNYNLETCAEQLGALLLEFDNSKEVFSELSSRYKQEKYISEHFNVVKPKTILLGHRFDSVTNSQTGRAGQVAVRETFQYVPILETLKMLFRSNLVQTEVFNGHTSVDGFMRDYCDGEMFQKHPLLAKEKGAIQINLFFDELEVTNPLGSKTGIHKLGAFYYVLKNLDPKFNSSLKNVHLLAMCNCVDIKKYGYGPILAPFMEELHQLESDEGVLIALDKDKSFSLRGTLAVVSADNLGGNSLFGFVESFSANMPCKVCTGNKEDFQVKFTGEQFQLRSKHEHDQHVRDAQRNPPSCSASGVKRSCILNTSKYFHVTSNFCPDVMHDVLEGIAPMELKLVLKALIFDEKLFTLDQLNLKISTHNYGFCDQSNKPSQIMQHTLKSNDNSLKQRAAQMWCLLRVVPLLIGEYIPRGNCFWELILKLRKITDIIFAPKVTRGQCVYLKSLIEDHHSHFKRVFPDVSFIPKHHFLVHYPFLMLQVGPVVHMWCMRFEAKHMYAKRLSGVVCCFKDICKTVTQRHQISHCGKWFLSSNDNAEASLCVANVTPCQVCDICGFETLLQNVAGLSAEDELDVADHIVYFGTMYRAGMVVVIDTVNESPIFCRIISILLVGQLVYIHGEVWEACYFDEHLHSYSVQKGECYTFKRIEDLMDFYPLVLNFFGSETYISLKYGIM
ncbi:uncharacterized protein [Apostichopus japonicus]|uniref:uncharacterized protein isoform X1 n=1 Tax=Stichopus japonicus TaxID=307972 RepID=UPI003AB66EDF